MKGRLRINHQIRLPEVFVIDETGKQLGVLATSEAMRLARERGFDLVEVEPIKRPPIAKFLNYGKFMYDQRKQQKGQKVKHKTQEVKTVRIGFRTDKHDMEIKAKKVDEFLKKGYLISIQLMLRGREKALAELGKQKLLQFVTLITVPYQVIKNVQKQFGTWSMMVKPGK